MIRVAVNRGAFHPPHMWGAPRWVTVPNGIICLVMMYAIGLSWWLVLPPALSLSIQAIFASLRKKGPFYLRFLIRTTFGPIRYLDP